MSASDVSYEPLDGHPREAFSCAYRPIQHFFRKWAEVNHGSYTQRVFVACKAADKLPLGFYSLTLMTFEANLNEEVAERYKKRRVPTIYMGAIARDQKLSERGFGFYLMKDAMQRCLAVREIVGVYALSLHAANERVAAIYEDYGFSRFVDGEAELDEQGNPRPAMFIRLADVAAAFEAA
ncbi:MAG TPA: hypothetical protein VGO06_06285 [Bosea sp. (in: a-proteobacteria)]|jgi:GNAT superfamily N-acetyltransferase|uniref:hypothetical protein n=1 Tax=Bosea sp. (in: a-proteobacteria) TaxID=1871050 RepID=UPI002E0E267C|nr:hypothetical protein [Bosea sp. (in: a-proteobacteria)]